jgi:ribosome-binding factor A
MTLHSRLKRINEDLKLYTAEVIDNELKDPRTTDVMITVTSVSASKDLRHAEVFVSVLADDKKSAEVIKGLTHSAGFIRSAVAQKVSLRFMPELSFKLDETARTAARINTLLKKIEKDDPGILDPEESKENTDHEEDSPNTSGETTEADTE